jgi:predicted dithiol-disulfide oxidoreductase (DUF899 family)
VRGICRDTYIILDHAPMGRDEGDDWQLWIRRHDEYDGD